VLSLLSTLPQVSYLIQSDNSQLFLEFPLLEQSRLSYPQLEYLADITCSQPIFIQLTSSNLDSESSFTDTPSLAIPSTLPLSRQITLPSWSKDTLLFDYIHSIERLFLQSWYPRQLFIYHLQSLCAVLEFDPIDFSTVTVALKLSKNKMTIVCTVEIQIPFQFPQAPLGLLVQDLLHRNSYPLPKPSPSEMNGGGCSSGGAKAASEMIAKNVLLYIVKEIGNIAFSDA
jgi:hypothetical protein